MAGSGLSSNPSSRGPYTPTSTSDRKLDHEMNASGGGSNSGWVSEHMAPERLLIPLIAVALLLSSTANSVMFKKMTNKMPNYPFFLVELSTIVYLPICWLVCTTLRWLGKLEDKNFEFPKHKFAVVAALEGIGGILCLFGGTYTKGTTQMCLAQASIPITMALSVIFLRTKFEWMQYTGALVILSGVFVVLSPKLFAPADAVSTGGSDIFLFNVIFFLSILPNAFANIYKEEAFKDFPKIDVFYTMLWVGFFQTAISLLFLPFNSLPFLGSQAIPLLELPNALIYGVKCLGGVNTIVDHCYTIDPLGNLPPCDTCEGAWKTVALYVFINIIFNFFVILMIREGSAGMLVIIMTLRLPIGNMAFYLKPIMGNDAQPFDSHDVSGLFVILLGLVIYRFQRAPESDDPDAPYVLTSVMTIMPGISEPVVTQIQRRPVTMKRTSDGIRGQLYSRLGMRPSRHYVDPNDVESPPEGAKLTSTGPAPERPERRNYGTVKVQHQQSRNQPRSNAPGLGISPIARSAPLYTALMARSLGSQPAQSPLATRIMEDESDSDNDSGSESSR